MSCTQKQQLVCFPKVRVYKPWFRHFNDHKDFRNEGTVHLFSLMALFSYANFRSNERVINGDRYMEAPGQWICKLGALPRILRVHSKTQALELMEYFQNHGFLTFEILDEEKEILRFTIADWKEHCTHLQYNYYSYKGSGFFFFPLPVGRLLLKTARKEVGIVFSELDAIMDMWLHTILNDPKVRGSEYMPVVYYSNMRGMPLLSYTYLARRWGWSKSRVGRFMLKAGEYGIISRVSFSSSRGSVISMCRYLAGAARRQQILTGIVSSGIIQTENGLPVCPVDFEGLRILIPIREMVLTEWPEEDPIPRSVRIQIGRMLGATIDFIPAAVDIRNRAAVGSRKAAMLQRQKRYYATGRVKPGILMACRVLGVGNNTMTVEACGVDTEIYARNVSWEWFSDIADLHSTGDLVVARVMDVSYNEERDVYSVNLSIKEASENPDRAALEKITPNSNYFGVVTGVKDRVFFVRLQVGVNAKTKLYRSIDMPSRLDTVSFRVTGVDEENGIALGFITRIIKRHTRLR